MVIHDFISTSTLWKKWEVYSEAQKELILDEFRRKYPDDHFDKRLLLQFLRERQQDRV